MNGRFIYSMVLHWDPDLIAVAPLQHVSMVDGVNTRVNTSMLTYNSPSSHAMEHAYTKSLVSTHFCVMV
jgi:hypothetical protein